MRKERPDAHGEFQDLRGPARLLPRRFDALIAQAQRLRERLAREDYGHSPVASSPAVIEPMEVLVDAATSLLRTLKGDQGSWEY